VHKRIVLLAAMAVLAGCVGTGITPGQDSRNRVVDIVNTTAEPARFYAKNAERRGVFGARFSEADVAANYYLTVNFDDGSGSCRFDLVAEFESGYAAAAQSFDTCSEVSWVIQPEVAQ